MQQSKKHKVTGVYWVFGDIPYIPNIKELGYPQVLDPLLSALKRLEEDGLFVEYCIFCDCR